MGTVEALVTYTKDGHKKKQKRWHDGSLKIDLSTRNAVLSSEEGQFISSGKVPADVEISEDSDEFILEAPSILCVITSIQSGREALGQANENAAPETALSSRGFTLPTGETRKSHAPPVARSKPAWPPPQPRSGAAPAAAAPVGPASAFRRPEIRRERSAGDILRLLGGRGGPVGPAAGAPPLPMPAPSLLNSHSANAEPTKRFQQPNESVFDEVQTNISGTGAAPPPAKRPRVVPPPPPGPVLAHPRPVSQGPSSFTQASAAATGHRPAQSVPNWNGGGSHPPAPPSSGAPNYPGNNNSMNKWDQRPRTTAATLPQHPLQPNTASGPISAAHLLRRQLPGSSAAPPLPPPGTIYFPTPSDSSRPLRRVAIPDRFPHVGAYQQSWENSLEEEITLKLAEIAKDFHAAAATVAPGAHQNVQAIETAMRRGRVPYHSACELFIWKNLPGKKAGGFAGGRRRQKKGDFADESTAGDEDGSVTKAENVYLILKSGRGKNVDYSKGDVWVISNDPFFRSGFDPGKPGDRTREPWVVVVRSLWFGPNQDGKFEVEFLSARPSNLGRSTPVYALKGPNASTELSLIDLLRESALHTLPILPALLGTSSQKGINTPIAPPPAPIASPSKTDSYSEDEEGEKLTPAAHAEAVVRKFGLNPDQAAVVRQVASWAPIKTNSPPPPPICLVFGPFGCGKSSLLVAVLHLILALRKPPPAPSSRDESQSQGKTPFTGIRVLVSAHTNVAVDRVLLGLLDSDCTDFLRVGALRRIDRRLLPHSLHASESKAHATAAAELKEMLREGAGKMSPSEEAALRAELGAMERGADRQRKKLLKTVPVVGVTCCSSLLPVLDNLKFDLVILDECSQIIEPLAMAPVIRAKAKWLVAAGDPKQLPPVIASPPLCSPPSSQGLLRPLFVRLSSLGTTPHLLRRQYRCHPSISAVPNTFYYDGRLLDGCTPEERPSLLPGLPPVVFVDVRGQEQRIMRSTSNPQEAQAVLRVVERALAAGVSPRQCGIICFYRAQVAEVRNLLQNSAARLQAAVAGARETAKLQARMATKVKAKAREHHDKGQGEEKESNLSSPSQSTKDDSSLSKEATDTEEDTALDSNDLASVQVATVDAFQGAEKDLIILTTATTRVGGAGAFTGDAARLNVALTRARHNLVVVGCAPALEKTAAAFSALLKVARGTALGYSTGGGLPSLPNEIVTAPAADPSVQLPPKY